MHRRTARDSIAPTPPDPPEPPRARAPPPLWTVLGKYLATSAAGDERHLRAWGRLVHSLCNEANASDAARARPLAPPGVSLTADERVALERERNREHARNTCARKKEAVEKLRSDVDAWEAVSRKPLQFHFNMALYESMRAIFVSISRELVQR